MPDPTDYTNLPDLEDVAEARRNRYARRRLDSVNRVGGCVYYLMVGPSTVKIGTTVNLAQRIKQLRTDLQYVVALEPGSHTLETQRHREFAVERIGRRENFRLSDRLKAHIESLQPRRDELVNMATTH